jgi:hypothetical protein
MTLIFPVALVGHDSLEIPWGDFVQTISRRAVLFGLAASVAALACAGSAWADGEQTWLKRGKLSYSIFPDQLEILSRLDPVCAAMTVGNAVQTGVVAAIDLSASAKPKCLMSAKEADAITKDGSLVQDNLAENTSTRLRVIPTTSRTADIIRVDQNWGGSTTLVRYAIVSIVRDNKRRMFLLVREVMPPTVASDSAAVRYVKIRGY